jgi:nucleoid DNA-binding protein
MVTKKSPKKKSVAPKAKAVKKAPVKAKTQKVSKPLKAKKLVKTVKVAPPKKLTLNIKKPLTKSQTVEHLSTVTGVKKKEVANLLEAIVSLMEAHLGKKGPGEMNFAGIFKCRIIHKSATKARQGTNPFTGAPMTFSAKPARSVIKIRPLKKLKEVVG